MAWHHRCCTCERGWSTSRSSPRDCPFCAAPWPGYVTGSSRELMEGGWRVYLASRETSQAAVAQPRPAKKPTQVQTPQE